MPTKKGSWRDQKKGRMRQTARPNEPMLHSETRREIYKKWVKNTKEGKKFKKEYQDRLTRNRDLTQLD